MPRPDFTERPPAPRALLFCMALFFVLALGGAIGRFKEAQATSRPEARPEIAESMPPTGTEPSRAGVNVLGAANHEKPGGGPARSAGELPPLTLEARQMLKSLVELVSRKDEGTYQEFLDLLNQLKGNTEAGDAAFLAFFQTGLDGPTPTKSGTMGTILLLGGGPPPSIREYLLVNLDKRESRPALVEAARLAAEKSENLREALYAAEVLNGWKAPVTDEGTLKRLRVMAARTLRDLSTDPRERVRQLRSVSVAALYFGAMDLFPELEDALIKHTSALLSFQNVFDHMSGPQQEDALKRLGPDHTVFAPYVDGTGDWARLAIDEPTVRALAMASLTQRYRKDPGTFDVNKEALQYFNVGPQVDHMTSADEFLMRFTTTCRMRILGPTTPGLKGLVQLYAEIEHSPDFPAEIQREAERQKRDYEKLLKPTAQSAE